MKTNLKKIRTEMGYSQSDIAEVLEMEQTHYSRYELDKFTMKIENYKKLAVFYNISIDYLCGLVDIPRTLTGISYADNLAINCKKKRGRE